MADAYPLRRATGALRSTAYDLLVIGGGIYGAWTACDAAQRGLKVALVEKNDWGSGTSSASSKLIHGGLRYLEHFEFSLVRHALGERRVLTEIAPHLVRPLRFMVPIWEGARVGKWRMAAGLTLYDLLSGFGQPVERHRSFTTKKLLERHPYLRSEGLQGGLSYGDCQEDDARMTLAVVAAAQSAGADAANRVGVESLRYDEHGGFCGAQLYDVVAGEHFTLDARAVVVAAGPWSNAIVGRNAPRVKLVKGVHLVMPAIPGCSDAFLFTAPQDGRVYFVIPWYGRMLLGTTEAEVADPTHAVVTDAEVRYLLDAARAALPQCEWTEADIVGRFAGVRTLQAEDEDTLAAVTREFTILQPQPRVILPIGGKYTTARCDAVEIVGTVIRALKRPRTPSSTHEQALPGAPAHKAYVRWLEQACAALVDAGVDVDCAAQVAQRHGLRIERLIELIAEDAQWAQRIVADLAFIEAEIVLAVRDEMALSSEDVLRRRMPLNLLATLDELTQARVLALIDAQLRARPDERSASVDEMAATRETQPE